MKKTLLGLGAVLIGLILITIFRANTVFEDVQLAPAENLAQVELAKEQVVERMAGATLESLEILAVMRKACRGLEAQGMLGQAELPLLRHLADVASA